MAKRIALILIISFAQVGTGQTLFQNNGFFILILNFICLYFQLNWKPFITDDLNSLDLKASIIMSIIIFCGLFSSICNDPNLEMFLLVFVLVVNCYFLILFLKKYIILQIALSTSKISKSIEKRINNIFQKGINY